MKSRSRWRRKTQNTSKFLSLTDRTGLTMGWTKQIKATPSLINRSIVSEAVDELPENLLTKPIQQKNITTRQQRLAQPAKKPFTMKKPYPQDKLVSIKRSLRCRKCDHNVTNQDQLRGYPAAEAYQSNHQRHDHHNNGTSNRRGGTSHD
ncbi:dynactin subunit 4-like [Culex quinquefasciatus]|uniref:dynactin subunit 4-like n=1 Tax=Culex quinquefasciatus TaxID=7176 RepID=UPI0018E2C103|nr:dynactin subunit 4-like [Culex quinquefasciatus]